MTWVPWTAEMGALDELALLTLDHREIGPHGSILLPDMRGKVYDTQRWGRLVVDRVNGDGTVDFIARRESLSVVELGRMR